MHIQRYLLRDNNLGAYFGDHVVKNSWDFDWHIGKQLLGITGNTPADSEQFIAGFLTMDDELTISTTSVRRKVNGYEMVGQRESFEQVGFLIDMLRKNPVVSAYSSSRRQDGKLPTILTFSSVEPSRELYIPGKIMPVTSESRAFSLT